MTFIKDYSIEVNDSLNTLEAHIEGLPQEAVDAFYEAKNAAENLVNYGDVPDRAVRLTLAYRDLHYNGVPSDDPVYEVAIEHTFAWYESHDAMLDTVLI